MNVAVNRQNEWLEADGLGGFASGTTAGIRTRRYHALLLAASAPPAGRHVLVNGLEAWVEAAGRVLPLSSQFYAPDVVHPDGWRRIESFTPEPWPAWRFRLEDGSAIEQEILAENGQPAVAVRFRLAAPRAGVTLALRPLLSGRDPHALQCENPAFRFDPERSGDRLIWRPYGGLPGVVVRSSGVYEHAPEWYRNFLYEEERSRGLDHLEDLASPGVLRFDLSQGDAILVLAQEGAAGELLDDRPLAAAFARAEAAERRRRAAFPTPLARAADAYLARRGRGTTVVAGYPWFGDWGRDTFIALRGLCLATGRREEAGRILEEWANAVSEGMLPNRFPDHGETPEYNSVDASLWYVIAVHDYLAAARSGPGDGGGREERLLRAVAAILEGYARGTRFGIRLDEDGLLQAGVPGVQLTWMDAKVGDWVVTPRVGKPVEVQALWLNALHLYGQRSSRWKEALARGRQSFERRFWNPEGGCLHDVVDVDHRPGSADPTFRPNQIFALGGLPLALLDGERARRVVEAVEARLLTPLGLRSLAPGEPGYRPRYQGGVLERDGSYHQGTVWPWLMGAFVEAWLRVHGSGRAVRREARERFLEPLVRHLAEAGIGHVSEIADAEPPHTPRGCPFQAWSVGELLRIEQMLAG